MRGIMKDRNREQRWESEVSDGCLGWGWWGGGGGKKVSQGFWERQSESERENLCVCVCAMCNAPFTCHRQTSYLPAVRMLQRLRHTAAIVLPLGQTHSSIIPLLSLLWTGLTEGHQGSVSQSDWYSLCPTATASTTLHAPSVPYWLWLFAVSDRLSRDCLSVFLYLFPFLTHFPNTGILSSFFFLNTIIHPFSL